MTQYDPNSQQNTPQQQAAQASPTAADNPQTLEQAPNTDNNTAQILQLVQKCFDLISEMKTAIDTIAKMTAENTADLEQLTQGNTSGGVTAVLG